MMKRLMLKGALKALDMQDRAQGLLRNRKGQSMVEWALIIVLIAVVVIGLLMLVGVKIQGVLQKIIQGLAGA